MANLLVLSIFLFQSQSNGSPILFVLIIASIMGAVADYKYKKAGGRKPSSRDRILFLIVLLIIIGLIIWAASYNAEIAGMITLPILPWLVFAWEVGRWRMRRKYPLPLPAQPSS